jgi:hypothetical protein
MELVPERKKRGRKKKNQENIKISIEEIELPKEPPVLKKRGRKPKGGKLILKSNNDAVQMKTSANIILHLKCSSADLHNYNDKINECVKDHLSYNPQVPPEIMSYTPTDNFSVYSSNSVDAKNNEKIQLDYAYNHTLNESKCKYCCGEKDAVELEENDESINIKSINSKLKKLKIQLYKNNKDEKKSACFWCSYEFDNNPCYIPKCESNDVICGYGSFCRPECAVGFLMKENIDDSTKFERYQLLNQIYGKIYNYKKNIKPAPNPYYLLDKYYGNLSIQEYRKLLKTEHMMLVIDRPLTRILPELHEDNDDFILNVYGGKTNESIQNSSSVYKVKKNSEKSQGPSKTSIIRNNFGFA